MIIFVPTSWRRIGYLIFGSVGAALCFLSLASYSRVETVTGTITPDKGVAAILPTRSGVIASLSVGDGQVVEAGTELASVRAEEDSASGVSTAAQIAACLLYTSRCV